MDNFPSTKYYLRAYATNATGTAYGSQISFTTLAAGKFGDIDGNVYDTVIIGTQIWMKQNLRTSKYRNGSAIPLVSDSLAWMNLSSNSCLTCTDIGAYCWYNNDSANLNSLYGKLYNGYVVIDSRGVCPTGFHVPSDNEWTILENYLGGTATAGGALKEVGTLHWLSPNTGATNLSRFTALPGGYRGIGSFNLSFGYAGFWWTSTYNGAHQFRSISYNVTSTLNWMSNGGNSLNGYSIRCVKD